MRGPLIKLALDLGPLIIFFVSYRFFGIFGATGAFMVAVLVALMIGFARERKLQPMPLFSAALVMVFGGLTLYLKNAIFIKMKVTILYAFIGLVLIAGLAFNRLFIRYVFGQAFDLSEEGWRALTWRWAFFSLGLACLNEIVWRNFSTTIWVDFKVAILPLVFFFALAQTPLIMKHDRSAAPKDET